MSEREQDSDRLVAVGLAELVQGRVAPDVRVAVAARLRGGEPARPDRLRGLLRAALWLWAIAVVVGIARFASAPREVAQEPEPDELPMPMLVQTLEQLARVDAGAQSLIVHSMTTPADLLRLERLQDLRRLWLGQAPVSPRHDAWAALAGLPKLEDLMLALPDGFAPDDLLPLAAAPRLESLKLIGRTRIDRAVVHALAQLPRLRKLCFITVELTADGVRALADLPRLEAIELRQPHCDEEALLALQHVHRLKSIQLESMGDQPLVAAVCACRDSEPKTVHLVGPGLTVHVAEALSRLPLLERLELQTCAVSAEALRALPARLSALALTRCLDAGPEVFDALRGRTQLRSLTLDSFTRRRWLVPDRQPAVGRRQPPPPDPLAGVLPDQAPIATAQARLIASLSVRDVQYEGVIPPVVAAAIAAQRDLESFGLRDACETGAPQLDLSFLVDLPNLRRVRLHQSTQSVEELAPLARSRSLQRLDLSYASLPVAAVEALLPGVAITAAPNRR